MGVVSDNKLLEICNFYFNFGKQKTIETFALKEESFERYMRDYKKKFGDSMDVLSKIRNKFSDEELNKLLENPDYKINRKKISQYNFDGEVIRIGVMSDTHIGSSYTEEERIIKALQVMDNEGCELLLHAGDLSEGMSGRDGHVYELKHIGYSAQLNTAIQIFSNWKKPAKIIAGNHDLWYLQKANIGADIVGEFCSKLNNFECIGFGEGDVIVNGVEVKLFHGNDGASYALSYREQKLIDSFTGGEKPGLLITGHTHKTYYMPSYRNIHTISAGTLQNQTPFMRGKKLPAHVGFWIVDLCIGISNKKEKEIKYCAPRFYSFYE